MNSSKYLALLGLGAGIGIAYKLITQLKQAHQSQETEEL